MTELNKKNKDENGKKNQKGRVLNA